MRDQATLDRDLRHATFSALILIDCEGVEGREVADFLKEFADRFSYTLYRLQPGCYALRDHEPFPNHARFESELELLLQESKVRLTLGISLERRDAREKAQKALTFAKKHDRRMIAYSRMVENALETESDPL